MAEASTLSFTADRRKLNPKFDSYKLHPLDDSHVSRHPLPSRFSPSPPDAASGDEPVGLGYKEARARARWNHLDVDTNGLVAWIGGDGVVWTATDFGAEPSPKIEQAIQLPPSGGEYPTLIPLDGPLWLGTSGNGDLHLLRLTGGEAKVLASSDSLPVPSEAPGQAEASPSFKLHAATSRGRDPSSAAAVVSVVRSPSANRSKLSAQLSYTILVLSLVWSEEDASIRIEIEAQVQGADAPAFVAWHGEDARPRWLLASTGPYALPGLEGTTPGPPADPVADNPNGGVEAMEIDATPPPQPYTWIQTPHSVSISIYLPAFLPASSIAAAFGSDSLHLRITRPPISEIAEESLLDAAAAAFAPSPKLWGAVAPQECTWTWDRPGAGGFGVLTLELEKAAGAAGGRWPHVFAADDGVPESLDPSERRAMLERLERYTSDPARCLPGRGLGAGPAAGAGSLTAGERDPEIDDPAEGGSGAGEGLVFTWLDRVPQDGGGGGGWSCAAPHPSVPAAVVATPLRTSSPPAPGAFTIVTQHDVDGLLFSPPPPGSTVWSHASTFPALAFVVASKRDARFVRHVGARAAVVWEGRGGKLGAGNMFLYHAADGPRALYAKQEVVRVGSGLSGALMGVCGVQTAAPQSTQLALVCLCENELVVIKGLL